MDLSRLRDPKVMIAAGAGVLALVAALGIGIGALVRGGHKPPPYRQVPESGRPTIVQKDTFYPALATA